MLIQEDSEISRSKSSRRGFGPKNPHTKVPHGESGVQESGILRSMPVCELSSAVVSWELLAPLENSMH